MKNSATTNQKHTTDSQKPKRREHKHKMKRNHQTTRRKRNKEETKNQLEKKVEMAINTYVPIITLHDNGLNTPIKRHRVAD